MKAACLAVILALAPAPPLAAQVEITGELAAQSQAMDRGLTLSAGDPAGYVAIEAGGQRWFGGLQAGRAVDFAGNDAQLRGYLGYATKLGAAYDVTLTLYGDGFIGGDAQGFFEARAAIARDFGLFYTRAQLWIAPDGRWSSADQFTTYTAFDLDVPFPRAPWLTGRASIGYSIIDGGADGADWALGLAANWRSFELSARYTESTRPFDQAGARAQVELRAFF